MRKHAKAHVGHGLSRFLVTYMVVLFGILMLVHAMQPPREPASSSRSPVHQERQSTAKKAATNVVVCQSAIG
jgi:hypothetical protein